jgi:hypothetical protein
VRAESVVVHAVRVSRLFVEVLQFVLIERHVSPIIPVVILLPAYL